jgi:hypothetical protein
MEFHVPIEFLYWDLGAEENQTDDRLEFEEPNF